MSEFFAMGGYALYVWPAYVIAAVSLVLAVLIPIRRHRKLREQLSSLKAHRNLESSS